MRLGIGLGSSGIIYRRVIMYESILQELGLSKNEARIYEALVSEGESGVGVIAVKSKVHRRNVYDSIKRLVSRGLVFEIVGKSESLYQAVEPVRLNEMLEEKRENLGRIMPALETLYRGASYRQQVCVYRGPEGWKNYMRDMLRVADEAHFIGAQGAWLDERVKNFFPYFSKEAEKKGIRYYHLFDHKVKEEKPEIIPHIGADYKFLPKEYSSNAAVDIFGNHVNILTEIHLGRLGEEIRFIVIVDEAVANAFRTWFKLMWDICPD